MQIVGCPKSNQELVFSLFDDLFMVLNCHDCHVVEPYSNNLESKMMKLQGENRICALLCV